MMDNKLLIRISKDAPIRPSSLTTTQPVALWLEIPPGRCQISPDLAPLQVLDRKASSMSHVTLCADQPVWVGHSALLTGLVVWSNFLPDPSFSECPAN